MINAKAKTGAKPFPELSRSKAQTMAASNEYPAKVICFRRKPVNVNSLSDCPSHFDISALLLQGDQLFEVSKLLIAAKTC